MDPFPRQEALAVIRRLPAYGLLAWRLSRDPDMPAVRRGALIGAAVYLVSPVDAVPGIIPLLGQLDDLVVVVAALRFALSGMSPQQRRMHLEAAGLSEAALAADEQTLSDVSRWAVRRGAQLGARVTKAGLRASARAGRQLGQWGRTGAAGLVDAAGRLRRS
jgi:uncharacterized membrane protein YkvA (DUF1232 family)